MDNLMTWTNLGTLVGATAAVLLIVQYLKPALPKLPTRWLALIVAVVILEAANLIAGAAPEAYALALLNAVLVATSAMGTYQVTFKTADDSKKADGGEVAGP